MKNYEYVIDLDERGSFLADVRDPDGRTVYEVRGGDELGEDDTSLVEDGFMRSFTDTDGLADHLRQMKIIEPTAQLTLLG